MLQHATQFWVTLNSCGAQAAGAGGSWAVEVSQSRHHTGSAQPVRSRCKPHVNAAVPAGKQRGQGLMPLPGRGPPYPQDALDVGVDVREALGRVWQLALNLGQARVQRGAPLS